jgi:hypothetical protein
MGDVERHVSTWAASCSFEVCDIHDRVGSERAPGPEGLDPARKEHLMTKSKLRITAISAIVATTGLCVGVTSQASAADANCWGVVSSQAARVDGKAFGGHASEQATPRLGLGNTARALGFDSVAELGVFLASVDGIDETNC